MKLVTVLTVLAMTTGSAWADGAVLTSATLHVSVRSTLSAEIAAAKKANPGPFAAVASVRANMAKMDAQKRGRRAPVSLVLKPIGADALLPLLNEAAFDGARGDLNESAWLAWQVGVLETIGMIRDERALPVLEAALKANTQPEVVRAAAEALGRLGTEEAAQALVKMSADSVRGAPVLSAMGSCRRLVIAQALAARAENAKDERVATMVAKALGDVGNAWAWETPAVRNVAAGEEGAVRQVAADALLSLYVRFEGPARQAASNALLVVNSSTTASAITALATDASPETRSALDALAQRFARNPAK